jgi:hypothetical protein
MAISVERVSPSLGEVDNIIREFEADTRLRVSTPARLVIQQFFISLHTDRAGFIGPENTRQQAIEMACDSLYGFLESLGKKTPALGEIGLLLIVQNINNWALEINCPCWPR